MTTVFFALTSAWPKMIWDWEKAHSRIVRIVGVSLAGICLMGAISGYRQAKEYQERIEQLPTKEDIGHIVGAELDDRDKRRKPLALEQKDCVFAINGRAISNANHLLVERSTDTHAWDKFDLTMTNRSQKSITYYVITLQVHDCEMRDPKDTWDKINIEDGPSNVSSYKTARDFIYQTRQIDPGESVHFPGLKLNCQRGRLPSKIRILLALKDTPLFKYGIDFGSSRR